MPSAQTPSPTPLKNNSQPTTPGTQATPSTKEQANHNPAQPTGTPPSSSKNPAGQRQGAFLNFIKTKPSKQQIHDYLLKQNSQLGNASLKTLKPGPNPVRKATPGTNPGNISSISQATKAGLVFTVTTLVDKDEGYCGANCSLREAIYAANDAAGPVTIKFNVSGTITLNSLPPYITNKAGVTIDGNGQKVIIQGYKPVSSLNDFSRAVFTLNGSADDFTTDCSPYFSEGDLNISGVSVDDCSVISSAGTITITNSTLINSGPITEGAEGTITITGSTLTTSGPMTEGVEGTITITNSTLNDSSGVIEEGNEGTLTITDSTLTGYSGVDAFGTAATITDSNLDNSGVIAFGVLTIAGSGFTGYSGVIGEGPLTITGSTFSQEVTSTPGRHWALRIAVSRILRSPVWAIKPLPTARLHVPLTSALQH